MVKIKRFLIIVERLFFLWEDAKKFVKEKFWSSLDDDGLCGGLGLTDMLDQLEISGCIMRLIKSSQPLFWVVLMGWPHAHTRHAFTLSS